MALAERITPFIPTCSRYNVEDFVDKWESRGQHFNLTEAGTYVYNEVLPSVVPGIVFGVLALVGFLVFLIWMFVGCCIGCCRCCRGWCKCCHPAPPADPAAQEQFISTAGSSPGGEHGATYPLQDGGGGPRKCLTWRNAFWAFFWAVALTLVGISAWGLAESIRLTDTTVSDFWQLVDDAQMRVENSIEALQTLQSQAQNLTAAAQVLAENDQVVVMALQNVPGVTAESAQNIASRLSEVPAALSKAPEGISQGIAFLQDSINHTITDMEDKFKPPTMALQETWRFIPIAVVFGVLMVLTLLAALAVFFMSWRKTAAFLVALLWLFVALLMLLGTGLLRGVYVVSDDGCLYAESYVVAYARHKAGDSKWGELAVYLVKYYLNAANATVTLPGGEQLTPEEQAELNYLAALPGASQAPVVDIEQVLGDIGAGAQNLATIASSPQLQASLQQQYPMVAGALTWASTAVGALGYAVSNLTEIADRNNTTPLYHSVKEYICCGLAFSAYDMWVAWTVAGCLGFALALLASGRIIAYTRGLRKKLKVDQGTHPGGAALWMPPPPMAAGEPSKALDYYQPPPAQAVEAPPAGPAYAPPYAVVR